MKKIEELEKELEEKFEDFKAGYKSYETMQKEIEPAFSYKKSLDKPKKKFPAVQTMAAIAACILLILTGGVSAYFLLQKDDFPQYRYEDTDLTVQKCTETEFEAQTTNLYLPNFSMLTEKSFWVATHNISYENVYFTVSGFFDNEISLREIKITIILKNEYHPLNEANFLDLENSFTVKEKTVTYSSTEIDFPFYSYHIAFTENNVRYYINYKTIDENDIETFFAEFLQ